MRYAATRVFEGSASALPSKTRVAASPGGTRGAGGFSIEDEADADIEGIEESDAAALPIRIERPGVERHRVLCRDGVKERHEVVARLELHPLPRVPEDLCVGRGLGRHRETRHGLLELN